MSFLSYDVYLLLTAVIVHSKHFSVCDWLRYPGQLELTKFGRPLDIRRSDVKSIGHRQKRNGNREALGTRLR